jgi:hypothetical protein
VLIFDGWPFGIKNRVCSHGFDYLASLAEQDRSNVVFLRRGVVDIRACADVFAYALVAWWLA